TTRHQGGGHKRQYRLIDFKRNKDGILGSVVTVEYDPNRSANNFLIHSADDEKRYILSPKGLTVHQKMDSAEYADIKPGNSLPLANIPIGTAIHNVALQPGRGGKLVRSAGASAQVIGRDGKYTLVRLASSEVRRILSTCRGTVGQVGNIEHELVRVGKAGRSRWVGKRPSVRGFAMNPIDHPHGGGEGRSPVGRPSPVSPWGK